MTTATAPAPPIAPTISSAPGWPVSHLLRLAWRRDRILIPSSVLGLVVLSVGSAQATLALYPTDESASAGLASVVSNPSVIALYGPVGSSTADALAVFKTVMMGAFLTAVLAFVVVRRHTRTEEDEGRLELLGSGVVGRWSALAAAVTLGTGAVVAATCCRGWPGGAGHGPAGQCCLCGLVADVGPGHGGRLGGRGAARLHHPGRRRARIRLPRGGVRAAGARRLRRPGHLRARPGLAVAAGLGRTGRGLRRQPHLAAAARAAHPGRGGRRGRRPARPP